MLRILMFDVGNTLIMEKDLSLFPHVLVALDALHEFTATDGRPLASCLVSNFPKELPVAPEDLSRVFHQFLGMLPAELIERFDPVDQRVTLSAHAGVPKPDPKVFTTAIGRLGLSAGLDSCLLITEEHNHIVRAQQLGMSTLQFGGGASPPPAGTDFADWSEAPMLISHKLNGHAPVPSNLTAAVRARLAVTHPQLKAITVQRQPNQAATALSVQAQALVPLHDPALGDLDGVCVSLPVTGSLKLSPSGRVLGLEGTEPSQDDLDEVRQMVRSLANTGQIKDHGAKVGKGPTHEVIEDPQGRRVLRRKRFSAI
jgi:beta-phosphoglucomutase-like phosphatase (HAD superfamily)